MEIEPFEIPRNQLPLNREILSHMIKFETPNIVAQIVTILQELWNINHIPIITGKSIFRKITVLCQRNKVISSNKFKCKFKKDFIQNLDCLFDIAICQNRDENCSCSNCIKMIDNKFLNDQRSDRLMFLSEIQASSIDSSIEYIGCNFIVPLTSTVTENVPLTSTVTESTSRTQYQQDADDTNLFDYSFSSSPSITSPPDSDYLLSQSMHLEKASTTYEIDMESYIISCIARGTSNFSAAIHLNCLFSKNENWIYCHPSRIQRLKEKARRTATSEALAKLPAMTALFFDSKVDSTYQLTINGHEKSVDTIKADHYTLISEPNSGFVGVARIIKSKQKLKVCLFFFKF